MTYAEAVQYLFNVAPLFQNIGKGAYKEGLHNTLELDRHFGHPHQAFKTLHVAGTNGKGSCSHTLAAILQSAGYKVGLYTSPHLVDFRERIRVNGEMIPEQRVVDFVEQERSFFEPLSPSFFELATALAFLYFREQQVDIAVVEVGLGGRLDCTNIITPLLSVITNISFDHTQLLGDTLEKIAREKAGIIKPGVPVVIGETNGHPEVRKVFADKAREMHAPIVFADEQNEITSWHEGVFATRHFGTFKAELQGLCQEKNTATVLAALQMLADEAERSAASARPSQTISPTAAQTVVQDSPQNSPEATGAKPAVCFTLHDVHQGFANVCQATGLMGRWQTLRERPTVVCDTGHNPGGIQYIAQQLKRMSRSACPAAPASAESNPPSLKGNKEAGKLRIVIGMVSDKDVLGSLRLFPQDAAYYFTQASVRRAMPAEQIAQLGAGIGLKGDCFPSVERAFNAALADARTSDFIFVGGSSFIVADLLKSFPFLR